MFVTQSKLIAQNTLESLIDSLQVYDSDLFDMDCDDLKLQLSFEDKGILLINYHQTTDQLWVSSPISGAHHFALTDGAWHCTRSGQHLGALLKDELKRLTGEDISFHVA